MNVVAPILAGVLGVVLAAFLSRRSERRAQADRLLVEALNDAVDAIAAVAQLGRPSSHLEDPTHRAQLDASQQRYASAASRVAPHASPRVVAAFRRFQDDATTATEEGRERPLGALAAARAELGMDPADPDDMAVLLFGGPL